MTAEQANNIFKFNASKKLDKDVLNIISKACQNDNGTHITFQPSELKQYERIQRILSYLGYKAEITETYSSRQSRAFWYPPTMYQLYISWGQA